MPTGSGKTAVMAVLAQLSADHLRFTRQNDKIPSNRGNLFVLIGF
jgi:type I site-specific restriction-modification system R (restriction) subunit